MKLLLNECITRPTTAFLENLSFDIEHVEQLVEKGQDDASNLQFAKSLGRVFVTYDKDDFQIKLDWHIMNGHPGVIVIRMQGLPLQDRHGQLLALLKHIDEDSLHERLCILRGTEYEMRDGPGPGERFPFP